MIRKCVFQDIDSIVSLENENFKSPLSKAFIEQEINKNPLSNYLCYEYDNVVVGYIGLWITDIGSILNVAVDKKYRGKKIGSKLIEESIKVFDLNNIKEISLEVRVSNLIAINLYKKYDFKEVLIKKNYYADKEDAILMMRGSL